MSYWVQGVFGAAAISLTCGAVQLASGHDLTSPLQGMTAVQESGVNRAAKSDRAEVTKSLVATRTVSVKLGGLADTSVVLRLPLNREARDSAPSSLLIKSEQRKPMVACEPVVSVLTEVAKKLQPGRCVT